LVNLSLIPRGISEHNARMGEKNRGPSRSLVGLVALGFLAAAAAVWWFDPEGQWAEGAKGGMIRIGVVFVCLWLALPGRFGSTPGTKITLKLFFIVVGVMAAFAWKPKVFLMLLPFLGVITFIAVVFKPRTTQR